MRRHYELRRMLGETACGQLRLDAERRTFQPMKVSCKLCLRWLEKRRAHRRRLADEYLDRKLARLLQRKREGHGPDGPDEYVDQVDADDAEAAAKVAAENAAIDRRQLPLDLKGAGE